MIRTAWYESFEGLTSCEMVRWQRQQASGELSHLSHGPSPFTRRFTGVSTFSGDVEAQMRVRKKNLSLRGYALPIPLPSTQQTLKKEGKKEKLTASTLSSKSGPPVSS